MRLPNGYGSVIKLSGNRRRPYMVRITTGWTDDGKQKYQALGYFEKRADAIAFLANYNRSPFNTDYAKITFKEVFEAWGKEAFEKMSPAVAANHKSVYNVHCKDLYDLPYRQIRKHDLQDVIDSCDKSYSVKCAIRNLFTHLDEWAYDRDIISKMYSKNLDCGDPTQKAERSVFTDQEVQKLFTMIGQPYIDETIVQIYTGFRISEVLALTDQSVDLKKEIITGGGKTAAGRNRIVPIHPDILPIIQAHCTGGKLFPVSIRQEAYLNARKAAFEKIGMEHTTHDCRHTFRSKLDSAGANKVSIDLLMGHKAKDVGERVYTHKTIEELKATIALLRFSPQYTRNIQNEKIKTPECQ